MADPMRAAVVEGGTVLMMAMGEWRQRVPADQMPKQIALYRRLRDREGGKYAQHYSQNVEALENAARKAGIPIPPEMKKPEGKRK